MDSHTDDLAALADEAEALANESEQPDQALIGLAESVAIVNQANVQTQRSLQSALASIEAAPGQLAQSVEASLAPSLKRLESERRAVRVETAKLQERNRFSWISILGGVLIFGGAMFLLSFFYFAPKVVEYKAYARSHSELEASSVFGARVIESEGQVFVVFDEGVAVSGTCTVPNCVSIEIK